MSTQKSHHKSHSHKSKKSEVENSEEISADASKIPPFVFKSKVLTQPREVISISSEPFPVSTEFDSLNSKRAESEYDRSYWEIELFRRHPEIRDMVNRVDPITRAATFSSLYLPDRRLYPQEGILSLILQHLELLGLTQTASALTDSFEFPIYTPDHHEYSQLLHHLERGVLNADRFWNLLLPSPSYPTEIEAVQKQLRQQTSAVLGVVGGQTTESQPLNQEKLEDLESIEFDEDTQMPSKGTINQLVWVAASRFYPKLSPSYVEIFTMTYHGYMSSFQMLQKLQEAWPLIAQSSRPKKDTDKDKDELQFVVLVEKWIETSFFDFDAALLQNLTQWLSTINTRRQTSQKRMLNVLQKQIEGKSSDDFLSHSKFDLSNVKIPEKLFLSQFTLMSLDVSVLARQIVMSSAKYYYSITPKELLDCAWSKPSIRHRSPNVVALTNNFNVIADWVQYNILYSETIDSRLEAFKFFSQLAKELWQLHDYLDGIAIATAMNSNAIFRLKHHLESLPEKCVMGPIHEILDAIKER
ncbi:RasGEF domain containing protein [Histomonas meleagridis]|nr:RasGEF domain containing protein [Histomonas meleagridis]